MADTHFQALKKKRRVLGDNPPAEPQTGDFYFDNTHNRWAVYSGSTYKWVFAEITTTTSTSTSTTTTSTSTTTTSTSTTSSTSTTTSTSTSTTTSF